MAASEPWSEHGCRGGDRARRGRRRLERATSPIDRRRRRRRSSRPRPSSDSRLRSDGAPVGEALVEVRRPACSSRRRGRRTAARRRPGRARSRGREVVDVGAQHQQVVGGLDRHEPVAVDLDRCGALEDLDRRAHRGLDLDHLGAGRSRAGSTVLTLRISGRPRMPSRRVERVAHRRAGRTRGCWWSRTGAASRSASASLSSGEGLRGLAQHDPAVAPCGARSGRPCGPTAVRRTASIANGAPERGEPAGDPRVRDGAEVVGVGDERVAGSRRRCSRVEQAGAAQRGVEVAVAGRAPLEVGVRAASSPG